MKARITAAAVLLLVATSGQASAQGLFDLLFGTTAPSAPAPADGALTVHRRARSRPVHRPSVVRAAPERPADMAIDPAKVPDWYLKDPTLRRGDIVVLKSGVLVFMGRRSERHAADFASLRDARGIPARTRDVLARATAANAYESVAVAPQKPAPKPRAGHAT